MEVEILTLCDAATANGKLNILGAFDTIHTTQDFLTKEKPLIYHQFSVALRLRFSQIEQGHHKIQVSFVDSDGSYVIPPFQAEGDFHLAPKEKTGTIHLVFQAQNVKFSQFGEYAIDVAVDGREEGSIPLFVR